MALRLILAAAIAIGLSGSLSLVLSSAVAADAKDDKKKTDKKVEKKKDAPKKAAPKNWREAGGPLHVAAFEGDVSAVKKLLAAKDVDVNARIEFRIFGGYTPLHLAAYEGHGKVIDLLAAKKADLNLIDTKEKRTPLHIAAAYGRTEAVRALIKAGADLNLKDKNKNTALKLATEKAIIAELKKAGALEE